MDNESALCSQHAHVCQSVSVVFLRKHKAIHSQDQNASRPGKYATYHDWTLLWKVHAVPCRLTVYDSANHEQWQSKGCLRGPTLCRRRDPGRLGWSWSRHHRTFDISLVYFLKLHLSDILSSISGIALFTPFSGHERTTFMISN